jgi:hypothetical protein
MNTTGGSLDYKQLTDQGLLARLTTIRNAVTPILATNNFPQFTDHSVAHSDHLCRIVNELTAPLMGTDRQLSSPEAFVLYAGCDLHDVGMQHQNAGVTQVIGGILSAAPYNGQRWQELAVDTRRALLRNNHHRVSAEMVRSCVNAAQPTVLGVQLIQSDHPGYIACLCEAHGVTPGTPEYGQLVEEGPGFRMPLLAALLRLADILDESQRRSQLYLERTVELETTSRMHWWRNYYVADVTFSPSERRITMWFDFPPNRRAEYSKLVPELQLPHIREEFSRQQLVLGKTQLLWSLETRESPAASSSAQPMPNDVQMRMVAELTARREHQSQVERHATLRNLRENRPLIQREIDALHASEQHSSPDDHLNRAAQLARQLWEIGGRRDAWIILLGEQRRMRNRASPTVVLGTGVALCRMILEDHASDTAERELSELRPLADKLEAHDPIRIEWLRLLSRTFLEECMYEQAAASINDLLRVLPENSERLEWKACLAEAHLLQGALIAADDVLRDEGGSA